MENQSEKDVNCDQNVDSNQSKNQSEKDINCDQNIDSNQSKNQSEKDINCDQNVDSNQSKNESEKDINCDQNVDSNQSINQSEKDINCDQNVDSNQSINQSEKVINCDQDVDSNQSKIQSNFSKCQKAVSSESEWEDEDEEPISGTYHSLSSQRNRQKPRRNKKKQRKRLQRSMSTPQRGQDPYFLKSKCKISNLIQHESGTENESELQRSMSVTRQGQNLYNPCKSDRKNQNMIDRESEAGNESETDNLCSSKSSLSVESSKCNISFEKRFDYDQKEDLRDNKKIDSKFSSKKSHMIQYESGAENESELQRPVSLSPEGQNPYYPCKSDRENLNLNEREGEAGNESDTDSLNSSISAASSNCNISFKKKFDAEQQEGLHDNMRKGSKYSSKNSDTQTGGNDNFPRRKVDVDKFRKLQEELIMIEKSLIPSDIIMAVRKEIEDMSNSCIEQHRDKIDKISVMLREDQTYESILKLHQENLRKQETQFDEFGANAKQELNDLQHLSAKDIISKADTIKLQTENECSLFRRRFPAYAYRSDILNALKQNQVVTVSADVSYFFNIATIAFIQSGLLNHSILSCESSDMASGLFNYSIVSCESNDMASEHVKGKFEIIMKKHVETSSEINYLTEDKMLNLLSNGEFPENFIAVLNLPLKRSTSVDLSLAILRDLLSKQKNSRLILLTSIFDNVQKYKKYFSVAKPFVLKVPKLLLPVKTMWKREPSKNYKEDVIRTALSIHILEEAGNVLAFLPNEVEAKTAIAMFTEKIQELNYENVVCVLLHESSSVRHFNYQSNPGKRVVFFATDCAEIMPIQSVQYVIDCGLKRDYIFDGQKNLDILTTVFCSRAKARLRKSLICVYKSGVCYRMYNKENFCNDMRSYEHPDMVTMNPFNTLIKIFQHIPEQALSTEFVEPMNDSVKCHSIKLLRNFNAVRKGKLTQLGKKMVKLPLPARYSKLIFQAIDWGYAYEAVILVAYFSVDLFLFKHSEDEEVQKVIDAAKRELIRCESDALSFISIYRTWLLNQCSISWCDEFHIDYEALCEVKKKVSEICQYAYEYGSENICKEFNDSEDSSADLMKILLHSFGDNFCVFSGHHRSGYRILSSSQTAFLHPSSMICNKGNLPQFVIFNKMIYDRQHFLVGITEIPPDLVHDILTDNSCDKILDYDYSDIFERTLVRKTIEPDNERIIQILLGKKGEKLLEIEDFVKKELKTESFVIEPFVEEGSVHVYSLESFSDSSVKMVEEILKSNIDNIINAEQVHILELKKGEITVPLEIKCSMGAKITSLKIKDRLLGTKGIHLVETTGPLMKYSVNLTWIRRPCNGICYINFAEAYFEEAKNFALKKFCVLDSEVYVEVSRKADNQLVCTGVPREARINDIEKALKKYLPGIEGQIEMLYTAPFKTTKKDIEEIKIEIEDFCEEYTDLSDFEIVVPKPEDTDTMMTVSTNIFCTEDLTETAEQLSNLLMNRYKIDAKPVYQSAISVNVKIFTALKLHLMEEVGTLKTKLSSTFLENNPFRFDHSVHKDFVLLELFANDIQIMKKLQRTVNELLEGEVLNKGMMKDIDKLFCHGGHVWLKTLERSKTVAILEQFNSKIIRIYGSKENCFKVKRIILNFLEDVENETIILNNDKKNKILLKSLIKKYGVNLEPLIEECGLLTALLDIKSNNLLLCATRESISKAKTILDKFSKSLDSSERYSLLAGEEMCPVCANPVLDGAVSLICGHLYCKECVLDLVTQANFPIQCCAENCSEDIVLDDIIKIFDGDDEKFKKLLYTSLDNYLEQNRTEIVYCPAPGCSMFFFEKEVSGRWECPLCRNQICFRCNVVYHYGYTCDIIQGARKDPDSSYKAQTIRPEAMAIDEFSPVSFTVAVCIVAFLIWWMVVLLSKVF